MRIARWSERWHLELDGELSLERIGSLNPTAYEDEKLRVEHNNSPSASNIDIHAREIFYMGKKYGLHQSILGTSP